MFDLFILILIAFVMYGSYRNGLLFQAVLFVGMVVSFILAALLYKFIIPVIDLWVPYPSAGPESKFVFFNQTIGLQLDDAFYAGISFLLLFLLFYLVFRIFARGFNKLKYSELDLSQNVQNFGAIVLGLINFCAFATLIIFLVAMIPIDGIQNTFKHSIFAQFFVNKLTIFSSIYHSLFIK